MFKFEEKEILYIPLLLISIYFSFFYNLGNIALFDLDEGYFGEAAREMLISGNYLTTYVNGEVVFDKPPLIYWLQALSISIFGVNEFGVRLPSAIFASLWAISIYMFVKEFYGVKKAFLSAFFMIMSLQVSIISGAAIADDLLNWTIALSIFFIYLFYLKKEDKYIYFTFIAIAVGTLTKGPVAILIPLMVSFIFFLYKKEFKLWLKTIFNPIGWILFLIIIGPWYMMEYMEQGQKFIDGFFLKHNINRFEAGMEKHGGSIFYFIPVVLIGLLPFTTQLLKVRIKDDFSKYMIIWFLFVFIFFSISGTKLPHYVMYGYTGIIILMALNENIKYKQMVIFPIIFLTLLFIFPIVINYINIKDKFFNSMMHESSIYFDIEYRSYLIAIIVSLISLLFIKISEFKKIIVLGFIFIFAVKGVVLPVVAEVKQQPIKNIALYIKSNTKLYSKNIKMKGINVPSFAFYLEKITKKDEVKKGDLFLIKLINLHKYKSCKIIKIDGAYALLEFI